MAPVGHACWHAVLIVPSGTCTAPDAPAFTFCAIFAPSMRCTQKVHFSIMPRMRTETSGFLTNCMMSHVSSSMVWCSEGSFHQFRRFHRPRDPLVSGLL